MSRRTFRISISLLLILFTIVILQRNRIRSHYWAMRIASSSDLAEQGYYLACLASLGETARGGVHRLAHDPRPNVRVLAVYALQRLSPQAGINDLSSLLADPDDSVRDSAATALAFLTNPQATTALEAASQSPDSRRAAAAVSALGRTDSPDSLRILCRVARENAHAHVRAQAIESLMDAIFAGEGRLMTTPTASQPALGCDPVQIMVDALEDVGRFTGILSLERQKQNAARVASATSRPSSTPTRIVAEVAAACLSELTGQSFDGSGPWTLQRKQAAVDQCRNRILDRFRR